MPDLHVEPPRAALEDAVASLTKSRRPVIIVGHGARFAMKTVIEFAEAYGIPVITTFKAKGQIGDDHPLAIGVLGRSGTPMASWFMNECDLIVAFGASFSDHTGIYPTANLIQVDLDPMYLAKRHAITAPVLGDVAITARLFRDHLASPDTGTVQQSAATKNTRRLRLLAGREEQPRPSSAGPRFQATDQRAEIAERRDIWRREKQRRLDDYKGEGVGSAAIFASLSRLAPKDALFAVDVGNNTYSFGRYFEPSGSMRVLMSGYLGSIGFALPAAMGAYAATLDHEEYRGRKVISISGDGGLGQYAMELATVAKYRMNICHILLNNSQLGKITKEQSAGLFDVWETDLVNPSFAGLAQSLGIHAVTVRDPRDLDNALQKAISSKGPALVEIITDAELV